MNLTPYFMSAAEVAVNYSDLSASELNTTFAVAMRDIKNYKGIIAATFPAQPTHGDMQGSLVNWGRVNWGYFDPGGQLTPKQILTLFLNTYSKVQGYENENN